MAAILKKWNRTFNYKPAFKYMPNESVEDGIQANKAENNSLLSNEEDEDSFEQPFHESRCRRSYSLASVVILFGFGIFIGSFVPLRISPDADTGSFVPELPTKEYTFREFPSFGTTSKDMGNASWASILPPRNGMIQIDSPEKYDLPLGLPLYSNRNPPNAIRKKYALSVFHQLHCIQMLRGEYLSHLTGNAGDATHYSSETAEEHHERMHLEHCFDYLRQSVMCCSDTTVEWANPHPGPTQKPLIDGWNINHKQCTDWDRVLEFVANHAAPIVVD